MVCNNRLDCDDTASKPGSRADIRENARVDNVDILTREFDLNS